jgi:kynurenine formamidase
MWHYPAPYFGPNLSHIEQPEWLENPIYSEAISMPLQTGTYIETAAHVYQGRELIDEVSLERTVLVPAIAVQLEVGRLGCISRELLERAVSIAAGPPYVDKALVVGTGWSRLWDDPSYVHEGPYFAEAAIDFVIESGFGILGGDFPRYDNPQAPTGHLYRLFDTDTLLLAPLANLDRVGNGTGWLIAAPLRIAGASASPVRALWVKGDVGNPVPSAEAVSGASTPGAAAFH